MILIEMQNHRLVVYRLVVVVYRLQYLYYINFFYRVEFPELMLITYYLT